MDTSNHVFGLREKLALSYAALLVVVIAMGYQGVRQLVVLKQSVDAVFRENLPIVLSTDQLREGVTVLNSGIVMHLLGHPSPETVAEGERIYRDSYSKVLAQSVLPGERETVNRMAPQFEEAMEMVHEIMASPPGARASMDLYLNRLQPMLLEIRKAAVSIQAVNRDMLVLRNDATQVQVDAAQWQTAAVLLIALIVALAAIYFSGRWVLGPILTLTHATEEIRRGNYKVKLPSPGHDELGQLVETFNKMTEEISALQAAQREELGKSYRSRARILENLSDAIALVSPQGIVEACTDVAAKVFGLEVGIHVRESVYPWANTLFERALQSSAPVALDGDRDTVQVFIHGEEHFFFPEGLCIREEDGPTSGVLMLIRDVTHLRLQAELKRDAIATVSHQLKTPLTSIRMALLLLNEGKFGQLNARQLDLVTTAAEESSRLFRMLQGLLDMSRITSGKLVLECTAVPAAEVINTAVQVMQTNAEGKGITLEVDAPVGAPEIWVDPGRIEHVFTNLISNAINYSPRDGRVRAQLSTEDDWVRFSVQDSGPGVAPEDRPRIFEQFYRASRQDASGAGLGLSIVKQIVEAHGGRVQLAEGCGGGACFEVWLPRADAAVSLGLSTFSGVETTA
jgi:NtrC-family two-component system sensor histidine kinase KinB